MNQRQKAFTELYEKCHEAFLRYCSALAYGRLEVQANKLLQVDHLYIKALLIIAD
jgi:hypothetical protein